MKLRGKKGAVVAAFCAGAVALGCSDDPAQTSAAGGGSTSGTAGEGGTTGQGGAGGAGTVAVCEALGRVKRPFESAPESATLGAVASSFTVPTTAGEYELATSWSGCESYLFIQDVPAQNASWPIGIWERDFAELLQALPRGVQLFFAPVAGDPAERAAALEALQIKADEAFAEMAPDDVLWWKAHIHYVTAAAGELGAWLGPLMQFPGWGLGIDRFQRIRFIGSYADYRRFDTDKNWFAPNLAMVANEAVLYDFEADRQARLDAEAAQVIPLFEAQVISDPAGTGELAYVDVALPDAAAMATRDTLELDLALGCQGDSELGDCPTGNLPLALALCDEDEPAACDAPLGRWMAPIQREGRWVHDVSGALPLLAKGGTRRFAFYSKEPYEVTLSLRLSTAGKALRPVETIPLWAGEVTFDASYDDAFEPRMVHIPQGAKKVELLTTITGHGTAQPGNCAEFCDTQHTFSINGSEHVLGFPEIANLQDCMERTAEGTVPNQYGTWWYGRAGFCPGKEITPVLTDITSDVTLGGENLIGYEGSYQGGPYVGTGARVFRLTSAIVVSQ